MTVTGWGDTVGGGGEDFPNRMREANVPVVSDDEAAAAYNTGIIRYFPRLMAAAGTGNQDTCFNDSGGPLFVRNDVGRFIQVGITSFGPPSGGCADPAYPGVYTEVNEPSISNFISNAADR